MKKISSKLSITQNRSLLIGESEIFSELEKKTGTSLFFGQYPLNAVLQVLKKRSFLKEAKKRKLYPLKFDLDSSDYPPLQRFRIFYLTKSSKNIIVDLKIRQGRLNLKSENIDYPLPKLDFLTLDWLTLQNPLKSFSHGEYPFPGQEHPGLKLGKKVLDIFIYLARLINYDGILAFPAYFHNALLFSRYFHFFNPEKEGEILAIRKSFRRIPLRELAWIIHLDCLRKKNGDIYEWKAEEQVFPINKDLKKYFATKSYKGRVKAALEQQSYIFDEDCFKRKMPMIEK